MSIVQAARQLRAGSLSSVELTGAVLQRIAATEPAIHAYVAVMTDEALAATLTSADYGARVERGFRIEVEAFDWNCPQHITPRFTEAELTSVLGPIRERIDRLTGDNEALRARLSKLGEGTGS